MQLISDIFPVKNLEQHFISYKQSEISYLRFGRGAVRVICFHGYGEMAGSFGFFEKHLGDRFTFFSFDLPYHGKTEWNESLPFQAGDLESIVMSVPGLIDPLKKEPVWLMGFSLGGRVALSLYERMPHQFSRIVLLAPDGLKLNFWYWLATQTTAGNKLFSFTMRKPGWFTWILKALNRLGLVNSSIFKFVNYYIGDAAVRRLLYARWTCLRKLRPDLDRVKEHVKKQGTRVRLLYGKHDRIILPVRGEKFLKGIEEFSTLSIIHSGHQVLHEKHVGEISPALLP